jgi:hypothetical protein
MAQPRGRHAPPRLTSPPVVSRSLFTHRGAAAVASVHKHKGRMQHARQPRHMHDPGDRRAHAQARYGDVARVCVCVCSANPRPRRWTSVRPLSLARADRLLLLLFLSPAASLVGVFGDLCYCCMLYWRTRSSVRLALEARTGGHCLSSCPLLPQARTQPNKHEHRGMIVSINNPFSFCHFLLPIHSFVRSFIRSFVYYAW